jgi:hypothetical protein
MPNLLLRAGQSVKWRQQHAQRSDLFRRAKTPFHAEPIQIQESERADAWLSLDEEDSDPARFLADFIADMLLKLHRFRIRANVQITDPIHIEKE